MKTIYKYPLLVQDEQGVPLTPGAEPLCVQVQNGNPYLWAMVDDDRPLDYTHPLRVLTLGTGHDAARAEGLHYLDTYQLRDGALVFHVFIEEWCGHDA